MNTIEQGFDLQKMAEAKKVYRKRLAQLPIEEKLRILVEMQKRARAIRVATGRSPTPVWKLDAPDNIVSE